MNMLNLSENILRLRRERKITQEELADFAGVERCPIFGGSFNNKNDQEFLVQKIRSQYTEKESTKLDELKALDKKVKKPANVFAYVFGSISAVIMGAGMSLVMTELGETLGMGDAMVPGVIVGVIGLILVLINYPMYKKFLEKRNTRNGLLN